MSSVVLTELRAEDLPSVAEFISDLPNDQNRPDDDGAVLRRKREQTLRWRLLDNPLSERGIPIGHCLREPDGALRGVLLSFPQLFRSGDHELVGLAGGGFFTRELTGLQNYQLFRRYLSTAGAEFCFATTCNVQSGALWHRLGALPISATEHQFVLPFRLGPVAADAVVRRLGQTVASVAQIGGAVANPFWPRPRPGGLRIVPCHDWDRLAAIAERYRVRERITADRSAAFLRWRYEAPPNGPVHVFAFESAADEGWLSVRTHFTGQRRQLRTTSLLDYVGPDDTYVMYRAIAAVMAECRADCDLFLVRGRDRYLPALSRMRVVRRQLGGPTAYVYQPKHAQPLKAAQFDFASADGDAG